MGNTAVAVLHYDHISSIRKVDPRVAAAMVHFASGLTRERDSLAGYFGYGSIIAWDHASGYQVTVTHGNTGWRLGDETKTPPQDVLDAVSYALRQHGYKVVKPKEAKP